MAIGDISITTFSYTATANYDVAAFTPATGTAYILIGFIVGNQSTAPSGDSYSVALTLKTSNGEWMLATTGTTTSPVSTILKNNNTKIYVDDGGSLNLQGSAFVGTWSATASCTLFLLEVL